MQQEYMTAPEVHASLFCFFLPFILFFSLLTAKHSLRSPEHFWQTPPSLSVSAFAFVSSVNRTAAAFSLVVAFFCCFFNGRNFILFVPLYFFFIIIILPQNWRRVFQCRIAPSPPVTRLHWRLSLGQPALYPSIVELFCCWSFHVLMIPLAFRLPDPHS